MPFSDGVGFLLIHGLGGSNKTMLPLAEFLEKKNAEVVNENLPGHNTKPDDLRMTKWEEWVDFSQAQLDNLKKKCKQVFIVGTSLGGIVSLLIASKNTEIDGLILCSSAIKPFDLKSWVVYTVPFLHHIIRWIPMRNFMIRFLGVPDDWRIYEKIPVKSLREGAEMLKELQPVMNKITQPILILHSLKDKLVPFRVSKQITSTISSEDVTLTEIERGGHVMFMDDGCDLALDKIENWLKNRI